jgi:hypothetical protein
MEAVEAVEAVEARAIGLIPFLFALTHSMDGIDTAMPSGDEFFLLKTLRWRLRSHSSVAENPANCVAREEVILPLPSSLRKFAALSTLSSMVVMCDVNTPCFLVPLKTRVCFRNERHRPRVTHKIF